MYKYKKNFQFIWSVEAVQVGGKVREWISGGVIVRLSPWVMCINPYSGLTEAYTARFQHHNADVIGSVIWRLNNKQTTQTRTQHEASNGKQ